MGSYTLSKPACFLWYYAQNQYYTIEHRRLRLIRKFGIVVLFILSISFCSFSQKDTVNLEEIVIETNRIPIHYLESARVINIISKAEIQNQPVENIHDILKNALSVDVRQRGAGGVQSDISIRGGTFEQTLILINGIKINDPQTGHHNLSLPIDLESIERIEILQGPGSRLFGPNAFSGAINIVTNKPEEKYIKATITAGEHKYVGGNFASSYSFNNTQNYFSLTFKESDGYRYNTDFENTNLFYQVTNHSSFGKLYAQAGYTQKNFGANSFYSPLYPDQFEKTKTLFMSARFKKNVDQLTLTPSVYWRRNQDHFRLERSNPDFYTNNHLTNVLGGDFNMVYSNLFGTTALGVEYRNETILSNQLGEPMSQSINVPGEPGFVFTHRKSRDNLDVYFEHQFKFWLINLDLGSILHYSSGYDWNIYPGIDFGFIVTKHIKLFSSYNYSLRIPTYTELYYSSPTNLGNPNLKPEKSSTLDLGMTYSKKTLWLQVSIFNRHGEDLIDWAWNDISELWESQNVNQINALGYELEGKISLSHLQSPVSYIRYLRLNYSYLNLEKNSGDYVSFYILDYLKHKFTFQIDHKIYGNFGMNWIFNYQDRAGTYTEFQSGEEKEYQPFYTVDTKIYWYNNRFKVFLTASNLLDQKYFDLANIPMPERWIKVGLRYNLPL